MWTYVIVDIARLIFVIGKMSKFPKLRTHYRQQCEIGGSRLELSPAILWSGLIKWGVRSRPS